MHGGKALLLILVVGLLVATGVFVFVPGTRPGFVQDWFNKAKGYTKAKSAEDAVDKFKQAIEKRDFQAASLYLCGGDYKEWFDKGRLDSEDLARSIDDLRSVMKTTGLKSDKADFMLFLLEPFPAGFKFQPSGSGDEVTASFDWSDELLRHKDAMVAWGGNDKLPVDPRIVNSLMPQSVLTGPRMGVVVKKEKDGGWRIQIPVETGSGLAQRHVRDTVEYLRKNGSNFKNALTGVKNDLKNSPATKENFEGSLRTALEQSK
jgi:hypothetical protein